MTPTKSENRAPSPRGRRDLSVEASPHTTPLAPQTFPFALNLDETLPSNNLLESMG